MKGSGEMGSGVEREGSGEMGTIRCVKAGVGDICRAREGVAIMLSEMMWSSVKEWKAVSSRIIWVRLQCGNENWVIVSAYGPGSEKKEDERERFWEALSECVSGLEQSVRMVVLGDMNARVGNMEIEGVSRKSGVHGVNWASERNLEFCAGSGLIVGTTWFKKKLVNNYTWLRDSGTDEALKDWVLVDKRLKEDVKRSKEYGKMLMC
jgi:exonuclease III